MRQRRRVAAATLFASLILGTSARAENGAADLERELAALQVGSHVPGFCVVMFDADHMIYEKGFGFADLAARRPYTVTTVQPIGSISKTLIGMALMKGVERGWFKLDDDVNTILPFPVRNPAFPDRPITLRQLATHTSGIVDRETVYAASYVPGDRNPLRIDAFLKSYFSKDGKTYSKRNFAATAPGSTYAYSNIGATLAAYAVEVKAGESYADFTRKTFLQPMGMKSSGWTDAETGADHAILYGEKLKPYPLYTLATYPDGGLRTSCTDLARLVTAVLKGRAGEDGILKASAIAALLKPEFAAGEIPAGLSAKEPNQGIFWQYRREGTIGHFGGDPGVTTFMGIDPKTNIGRIVLANVGGEEALRAYGGELAAIWRAVLAHVPAVAPK
ncbi:beta-lactamase family protein [Sphingomonas sp. QA11]|uniref:serine hydrolase domain-containing protein n=1 Tax=Sphingomonas sp. QA11 TaxID=2950605 RepID=UPI00234AD57F|nr:serine hydrolase domain-containing protein [Sphingomonas sp. QA11]WCM28476.1 beta-lactamase family protein [Sphingomonas sp. QA11]